MKVVKLMSRVTTGNNSITRGYNAVTHRGVDIGWDPDNEENNKVIAHSDGKVVWVQTGQKHNPNASGNASYGNAVKIKHADGYYTLYAHLKSVKVKKNENVKKGQVIGIMGDTGKAYGRHLHFEVRKPDDTRINPTKYVYEDLPTKSKVSTYQGYDNVKNKWLPKVKSGTRDYAGNFGHGMSGFRATLLTYRGYDLVKNKWLPYVTGDSDYAGNLPNNLGGLEIKNAVFEVHVKNGGWITSVDGVANPKEIIDAVRIIKIN